MCRVLKVVLVAPADMQLELRRKLSALDHDIIGTFERVSEIDLDADVAVLWEPAAADIARLREGPVKVVALGGDGHGADLVIPAEDVAAFKRRVWELFQA